MHCSWAGHTVSLPFATLHDCLSDMYYVTSRCKQLALLLQNSLTVQRLEGILMGFIFRVFFFFAMNSVSFLFFIFFFKSQEAEHCDSRSKDVLSSFLNFEKLTMWFLCGKTGFCSVTCTRIKLMCWCTFRKKTTIDTHTQPTEVQSCMWNQLTSLKNIWKHCPVAAVAIMSLPFFPC